MRDALGNKLAEGHLLDWSLKGTDSLLCRVVSVNEGGLALGNSRDETPPILVVTIVIPVMVSKGQREAQLHDFKRVVDPASESTLDRALGGGKPS